MTTKAVNRYFWGWTYEVLLVRFVCVTAAGLVLFFVGSALELLGLSQRHRLTAVAGIASLGLSLWWIMLSAECDIINLVLALCFVVIVVKLSAQRGWTLEKWRVTLAGGSLFLSPLVPIFWINALGYATYPRKPDPTLEQAKYVPQRDSQIPPDNVYIFVCDEWSHRLTMADDAVTSTMPNLAAASNEMCVFTNAHSPGCHTSMSLPRLIFQRTDMFAIRGSQLGFWDGEFHPVNRLPSLFSAARAKGYRTYVVGWYHVYDVMLGDVVDFVRCTCYYDELGEGFGHRALDFLWNSAVKVLGDPISNLLFGGSEMLRNRSLVWQTETLLDYVRAVLDDPRPSGQFALFHLTLPHWPYCYGTDGLKPLGHIYDRKEPDLAREQHTYFDKVISELFDRLRATGKLQRSTIVLTSDHNWRFDPEMPATAYVLSRVPLLIRFPGQRSKVVIRSPFSTNRLAEVLSAVHSKRVEPNRLPEFIGEGWYHPLDDWDIVRRRPLVK
jgi:hypothetical protein